MEMDTFTVLNSLSSINNWLIKSIKLEVGRLAHLTFNLRGSNCKGVQNDDLVYKYVFEVIELLFWEWRLGPPTRGKRDNKMELSYRLQRSPSSFQYQIITNSTLRRYDRMH